MRRTHAWLAERYWLRSHYMGMLARCKSLDFRKYQIYQGRGIKVCSRWLRSFPAFKRDMGPAYIKFIRRHGMPAATLDRIDNDKGYSPSNCRWATNRQQALNTRCQRKGRTRAQIKAEARWRLAQITWPNTERGCEEYCRAWDELR